jgi:hypothetical protein
MKIDVITHQKALDALRAATQPSENLNEIVFAAIHGWDMPLFGAAYTSYRDETCTDYTENFSLADKTLARELRDYGPLGERNLTYTDTCAKFTVAVGDMSYSGEGATPAMAVLVTLFTVLVEAPNPYL